MALSVVVVLISAAVVSVISALSNSQYSKNQVLATQYAQEGMELVRKENNADPALSNESGTYCLGENVTTFSTPSTSSPLCSPNIPSSSPVFIRQIIIVQNDTSNCSGGASATVDVLWSDGKCNSSSPYCHDVKVASCFSGVNAVPTL